MQITKEQREALNKRNVELLTNLGFTCINNKDSKVKVCEVGTDEVIVDFSATDPNHFIHYALRQVYIQAFNNGAEFIKNEMKSLLFDDNNKEVF